MSSDHVNNRSSIHWIRTSVSDIIWVLLIIRHFVSHQISVPLLRFLCSNFNFWYIIHQHRLSDFAYFFISSAFSQSGEVDPDDSVSQVWHRLHDIDDEDIYDDGDRELTFSVSVLQTKTNDKFSMMISFKKVRILSVSEFIIINQDNVVEVIRLLIVYFFYDDILIFRNHTWNFNEDLNSLTDH